MDWGTANQFDFKKFAAGAYGTSETDPWIADANWKFDLHFMLNSLPAATLNRALGYFNALPVASQAVYLEEIETPIVIMLDNGNYVIFDGYHRIGGAQTARRFSVPAVVGEHDT